MSRSLTRTVTAVPGTAASGGTYPRPTPLRSVGESVPLVNVPMRRPSQRISQPWRGTPRSSRRMPTRRWESPARSEEHTSELQSPDHLVFRLLLEQTTTQVPSPIRHLPATPHANH